MTNPILTKALKIFIILLLCITGYFLITYTFSIILPIGLAIMIAVLMEPGVKFLVNKLKFPRAFASIAVLCTILVFLIGALIIIITEIYDGIAYLAEILPKQVQTLGVILEHYFHSIILPFYETVLSLFDRLEALNQPFIQENISSLFSYFSELAAVFFQSILFSIPSVLATIPESFSVILFIFLASLLLSADFPRIKHLFNKKIPARINEKLFKVIYYLKKSTTGFMKAQFILVAISFHLILLGLFILKIEHALTIALLMIVIDLIPYIGTGLLFIPWIFYSFLIGNYPLTIGLAIIYAAVILIRQLIEPKILSMNMDIHPLAWLFAVFIGFKIWGLVGLLLAPFIIVILKSLEYAGIFRWLIRYIND